MTFSANAILVLCLGLGLSLVGNFAMWQYANAQKAKVAPLEEAVREGSSIAGILRAELETCTGDKKAIKDASDKAIAEAQRDEAEAERALEEYLGRLANPDKLPPGCQAILTTKVCPALMDY